MARGDSERGYSRSRERDERIRAGLRPLAREERPLALRLSALLALVIALSNVIALAAGVQVQGKSPVAGGLLFALIMGMAAVGLWQKRYWAVLGFEALLGVSIVYAALSLMVAANGVAALLCAAVIVIAAPLFWFLIRIMARIQMPRRPPRERRQ
ncbi:MAG: hypothetical protein QOK21_1087 [Solirubrobacteraceae bacterium]|nr:hypothetical protein [Solirubrobacteraceae bacterium]